MQVHIRYLVSKPNGDGSRRYYWQPSKKLADAGWSTVALPPDEGMAIDKAKLLNAQLDAWYEAGKPRRKAVAAGDQEPAGDVRRGSVRELIQLYRAPPEAVHEDPEAEEKTRRAAGRVFGYDYATLKDNTKRSYDAALDYIDGWMGPLPVKAVNEAIVMEGLTAISRQRHTKGANIGRYKIATAVGIGRVGRLLFHASRTLVDPRHPCYVPKAANPWSNLRARERRELPVLWTKEARDMIIAAAVKLEWLSIAVAIRIEWWIGQREADVLALGHNFDPGQVLDLVQGKTAGSVHLPVALVPDIADAVAELRADQKRRGLAGIRLLIDERNGLLWDQHRFRKAFQDVRICAMEEARVAGRDPTWIDKFLAQLTFMRLRHTVVTQLYRSGCTIPEVAAITGHTISSVDRIIERYGVRDQITAGNAFQKRLSREGNE